MTESSTNLQVTTEFSNPSTIQTTTDSFGFTFTNIPTTTIPTTTTKKITLDILRENIKNNSNLLSQRQAKDSENEIESRQEEDEEEGGGGGLIGAIISGFLGSLSKVSLLFFYSESPDIVNQFDAFFKFTLDRTTLYLYYD